MQYYCFDAQKCYIVDGGIFSLTEIYFVHFYALHTYIVTK